MFLLDLQNLVTLAEIQEEAGKIDDAIKTMKEAKDIALHVFDERIEKLKSRK